MSSNNSSLESTRAVLAIALWLVQPAHVGAQEITPPAQDCSLAEAKKLMWGDRDEEKRRRGLTGLRCAAEVGDPEAQTYLATLLDAGLGVRQDVVEAASWLGKAATQKYAPAMTKLAFAHLHGLGVPHDRTKGRELLQQAASMGNAQAMANLGAMYGMGDGVAQSDRQAAEWYRKAAERGAPNGQVGLANMYLRGHGVEQSFAACFFYASLAAKQGFPRAPSLAKQCEAPLSTDEKLRVDQDVAKWQPTVGP